MHTDVKSPLLSPAQQPEHISVAMDFANEMLERFSAKDQNEMLKLIRQRLSEHRIMKIEEKDKTPSKIEVINQKDLSKYVNLVFDTQQAHRPFAIGILLVEINETTCEVKKIKPNSVLDSNFAEVLETKVSVSNLFQEVSTFAKFYKTQL